MDELRKLLYDKAGIRTYLGNQVDAANPDPKQISIEDIAHALSHQCRFGGHTKKHYSVAQHCWMVSHAIDPKYALEGLLHDAHEAYLVDLPSPIKRLMGERWTKLESNLDVAIYKALGLEFPSESAQYHIKTADKYLLEREFGVLVLPDYKLGKDVRLFDVWDSITAKGMFLGRYQILKARKG